MAIPTQKHSAATLSGVADTQKASIAMTPAMYELLSAGIYEDRILAIIRELSCNGRDAMKDHAKKTGQELTDLPAMDIQLPNTFEPYFYVRDYGTGLTHEQVFDIYLSYGKSTKTGSNDFVGMFGIGSKSPLAYNDSFIVTSYVDGKETQYNIYKDNGIPSITRLIERDTPEPNGLKVQVAVKRDDYNSFIDKTSRFLKLFDTPVHTLGAEVSYDAEVSEKNDLYWLADNYNSGCYALMGGVAYRLSEKMTGKLLESFGVNCMLLPFGIGELNIASSRENLSFVEGDATEQALLGRIEEVSKVYLKNVEAATSAEDTVEGVFTKLRKSFGMSNYGLGKFEKMLFKGEALEDVLERIREDETAFKYIYRSNRGVSTQHLRSAYDFGATRPWNSNEADSFRIFISDLPKGNVRCAREFTKDTYKKVLVDPTKEQTKWLTELFGEIKVVKCSEVYERLCPKVERQKSQARKVSGVFLLKPYSNLGVRSETIETIDGTETGYYVDMYRDIVTVNDRAGTEKLTVDRVQLNFLVDCGILPELYLIRGTASKKNRPPLLKVLTFEDIEEKINEKLRVKDLKKLTCLKVHEEVRYDSLFRGLQKFDVDILVGYPTMQFFNDSSHVRRKSSGYYSDLFDCYKRLGFNCPKLDKVEADTERGVKRFRVEVEECKLKNAFLIELDTFAWRLTKPAIEQLSELLKLKYNLTEKTS